MSRFMKAAVAPSLQQPLEILEVPVPSPGPGEVLVKIIASGVCHTDLHAVQGDWPVKPALPLTPGHEGAGIVAALGAGIRHLREGDAVGIAWLHDACGCCEHCTTGWETLCHQQHNSGYSVAGCFAEYAIAKADYVVKLPGRANFMTLAPILCAGVTTYKGIRETEVRAGEWLAVSGVGGLGHVAIQYAKAMGMHVVALDIGEDKLQLARSVGADLTVDASLPDAVEQVRRNTGGVHGALVTAANTAAFSQSLSLLRRRGTLSLVGLPAGSFPLPIFDVVLNRFTVRGSIVGSRQDLREALEFAADGHVRPHIVPRRLEDINDVLSDLQHGRINGRVVLDMQ